MSDSAIEKRIAESYEKENENITRGRLYQLVEQYTNNFLDNLEPAPVLQERDTKKFSAARFYNTALKSFKAPTEQAGKLGTGERQRFQKYIAKNIRGKTLGEKVSSINQIVTGPAMEDPRISEIMASLGALKMLQETLDDFNESTAGFLFEAFLSGLLQGEQVTERVGGTLPIEDCMFFVDPKTGDPGQPVSLKLLSTTTIIEGSIVNLLGFFRRPEIAAVANEKGIEYIVAVKKKNNVLDLYSFTITPSNFFMWLHEKHFNFQAPEFLKAVSPETEAPVNLNESDYNDPEVIKQNAQRWMNIVKTHRYPMMGLTPDQLKIDLRSESDWKKIIPLPSTSGKGREQVASIVLSDKGKEAYRRFTLFKDIESFENLEISEELEAQFLQQENPEARSEAAAVIAQIARNRRAVYLNVISKWSIATTRESAGHVTRYLAILNPKTGQMKAADAQQKLQALVEAGDADSIIRWATALEYARAAKGDTQFDIKPVTVRARGTFYGAINVDKNKIYKTTQKYSEVLEQLCAPIYEELENLSQYINGFYMQNRVGDAFKASESAKQMVTHTDKLSGNIEDK